MHLLIETTGIAEWPALAVLPPGGGGRGGAVAALAAGSAGLCHGVAQLWHNVEDGCLCLCLHDRK